MIPISADIVVAALAGAALGWLFSAAMLSVKVTMSVRRVRAWLKDRRK